MIVSPSTVTTSGTQYNVVLGTDKFQRIGAKVFGKHVYWNIFINYTGTISANWVRIIGFYPNK